MIYHVTMSGADGGDGSETAPWATLQKAVDSVGPGDTIEVGEGSFAGCSIAGIGGTESERITIRGQGEATVIASQLQLRRPCWTICNVMFMGETIQKAHVRFELFAHHCHVTDFVLDNEWKLYHPGIEFSTDGNKGEGVAGAFCADQPSHCLIARGKIRHVKGQVCLRLSGTENIIEQCEVCDCIRVDFLRVWGERHIVRDCHFTRNLPVPAGEEIGFHADFIQTFGNNHDGSRGHLFERLVVSHVHGQIGQLVEGTAASPELIGTGAIGDWTFRNCIFAHTSLGLSCTIPGIKFYNCVWYRTGGVATTSNATDRGSAVGWRFKNCVFLDVGDLDRNNSGWYHVPDSTKPGYYNDWEADYNFVAKNNFGKVRESTSGGPIPYRWWEAHGINGGDPGFVDVEALDFHLRPDSPLIGKGVPIEGFDTDFDGVKRGAEWDIGAFEATKEIFEPCPFCGSEDVDMFELEATRFAGGCHNCGTEGPDGETKWEARELWNQRA